MDPIELTIAGSAVVLGGSAIIGELKGLTLPRSLKDARFRQRHGLASELPWGVLVADDVVQLRNGAFQVALEISASPLASLSDSGADEVDAAIARSYQQLNARFIMHDYERFAAVREYKLPPGPYPNPYLGFIDHRRAEHFNSGVMMRSRFIKVLSWLPPSGASASAGSLFLERSEDSTASTLEAQLEEFNRVVNSYMDTLRLSASVRRLGVRAWDDRYGTERIENELLSHILWVVTGLERRVAHPGVGAFVSGLVALPYRGGNDIRIGNLETQIVVVKGLPMGSKAGVLDALKPLGVPYARVVRWIPDEAATAKKEMTEAAKLWAAKLGEGVADPSNVSRAQEARDAIGLISEGVLTFGSGTVWYIVRHHDKKIAKKGANEIARALTNMSYDAFVSGLTSEDEFFGTLCGNGYNGVRKFSFHNLNVAQVASLHGDSVGRAFAESPTLHDKTPAIVYGRSRNGNPVGIHLNHNPRDVSMWMMTGGMGRGKSFAENVVGAGWLARGGNTGLTYVEKGGSSYRLNRFVNGAFLRPGYAGWSGIALLQDISADPEDEDFKAVLSQLEAMVELQGVDMTPPKRESVRTALARTLGMSNKDLIEWSAMLDQLQDSTGELRSALKEYAPLFDTPDDGMSIKRMVTVELGNLLATNDPRTIIPVLTALIWKIRRAVKKLRAREGRADLHWGYIVDEAHALLEREQGCRFISEMFKEARKEQLWLGLATQSIEHYTNSPIAADIRTACGRGFWFRNSSVDRYEVPKDGQPTLAQLYAKMGCPDRGLDAIPGLVGYEVGVSDQDTGTFDVVTLEPDEITLAILGRSRGAFNTPSDNSRVDEFIARYGKDGPWRSKLLEFEGVKPRLIREMEDYVQAWKDRYADDEAAYA